MKFKARGDVAADFKQNQRDTFSGLDSTENSLFDFGSVDAKENAWRTTN